MYPQTNVPNIEARNNAVDIYEEFGKLSANK